MESSALRRLKELNTKECLWVYVIRILKDGPTHAYIIREEIKKRYGFMPGTMTAYKVLYLLSMDKLVKKKEHGRKKVYTITEKGKKELSEAISFYKSMGKTLS